MPRLPATELINQIEDQAVIIADGAMGTELMRRGALPSETLNCNRTHPDWVFAVHSEYIEAGARLLYSNTFAPPKTRDEYADVLAGWQILREVCRETKEKVWAALSLYPTTVCKHPDLMDEIFQSKNAPDLVVIETCCSLEEAKIAVREVRKRTAAYIFATATFSSNGRMVDGTSAGGWLSSCKSNRDMIRCGVNCDVSCFIDTNSCIIKPNAGMPDDSGTYADFPPKIWAEMLAASVRLSEWSVNTLGEDIWIGHIVGGCCGTTPEYIRVLADELEKIRREPKQDIFDFGRHW